MHDGRRRLFSGGAGPWVLLAATVLLCLCSARPASAGLRALLISSYHPGFPTFFHQIEGVQSVFGPAGVALDVEYMDSKRFQEPSDTEAFRAMLAAKLARLPRYAVILTADDNALHFVMDNREALFPGTPVVFFGVNDQDLARSLSGSTHFTGVIEAVSMEETLASIFRLQPGVRRVHAIVDGTPSGRADLHTYLAKRPRFPDRDLAVLSLREMTWAGLAGRIRGLGPSDAILLLSAYRDAAGQIVSFEDGLSRILAVSPVPVYDLWEHGMGMGAVGGKIISHAEQGRTAARMALDILDGRQVRDIPVVEGNEANRYVFDSLVLKRFGIDRTSLPEGSTLLNRPHSIWESYRVELSVMLASLALLGALICVLAAYILRLRRTRMRLHDSEERLQMALEATSDGLWDWDIESSKFFFSPGYFTMLGYAPGEFPASYESWRELLHPDDVERAVSVVAAHILSGNEFRMETRMRNKGGGWTWIMARGKTIAWTRAGRPKRAVGTHTDITDIKRIEERLTAAKESAEAANRVKDEFIANISHEVRTPLNGVMGMLQLLQSTTLDAEQANFVDTALQSSRSLLRVLNDLLDFSKIQAGKLDIREAPFDLAALVEESVDLFRLQVRGKPIRLAAEVDASIRPAYLGDAGRIRQILFNLVGNAAKFTSEGAITVRVCELWHPWPGRKRLLFSVRDTGIGIAAEDIDEIFAPFAQVDGSLTRTFQGTGLGLPIVNKLVGLMGGTCEVESEPDKGTAVHFFLNVGEYGGPARTAQPDEQTAPCRPLRLLLVEDERVNRLMAQRLLEGLGHTVATAENGLECLKLLHSRPFDVVLMDIQMPIVDGIEATRTIRQSRDFEAVRSLPIIGLSAHAARQDRDRALEAGMNEYLVKPFEQKELEAVLRKVVS